MRNNFIGMSFLDYMTVNYYIAGKRIAQYKFARYEVLKTPGHTAGRLLFTPFPLLFSSSGSLRASAGQIRNLPEGYAP